jgi:hypothetical protein
MTEAALEDVLRQADALVVQALKGTDARCAVLGRYISDFASFVRCRTTAPGSCTGTA